MLARLPAKSAPLSTVAVRIAAILCASSVTAAQDYAAATTGSAAVWRKHEHVVHLNGFTTEYSCLELESKLRALLLAAGARGDISSHATGCDRNLAPARMASVAVSFYALAVAVPGASPQALGAWRRVQFESGRPPMLHFGDCELLEQFATELLPLFTTRAEVNRTACVPNELASVRLELSFETLMEEDSAPR